MPSVHLRACSFAHTAATPILEDVTLDLADGWVGIMGPNGAGKTTLLDLVARHRQPTAGEVHVVADVPPVLCPQEVGHLDDDVRTFSWDWSGPAARLRSRLELDPDDLDRWATLSPGERKRWQVGTALAAEPDVLLLDEPTNHLDARARREEQRLRQVLADVRRDRSSAERGPRRERRTGPKDSDARGGGPKFAQQKAERKLANRVHQLNSRVDRAGAAVDAIEVSGSLGGDVTLHAAGGGRRWVGQVVGDVAHAGGGTVLHDVDVGVARGEHVQVLGPNGAGKSTLVDALLASTTGRTAWLLQELDEAAARAMLEEVRTLDLDVRGRVLGIVANLGVDPDRLLVTDRPSPGEARKLALALLLVRPADLVVLDEPTNHLDLPAIERLEAAVTGYPGALVLVTHDLAFARATTTTTWLVGEGRVDVRRSSP